MPVYPGGSVDDGLARIYSGLSADLCSKCDKHGRLTCPEPLPPGHVIPHPPLTTDYRDFYSGK